MEESTDSIEMVNVGLNTRHLSSLLLLFGSAKFQDDICHTDDGRGLMLHTTSTKLVFQDHVSSNLRMTCDQTLQTSKHKQKHLYWVLVTVHGRFIEQHTLQVQSIS